GPRPGSRWRPARRSRPPGERGSAGCGRCQPRRECRTGVSAWSPRSLLERDRPATALPPGDQLACSPALLAALVERLVGATQQADRVIGGPLLGQPVAEAESLLASGSQHLLEGRTSSLGAG